MVSTHDHEITRKCASPKETFLAARKAIAKNHKPIPMQLTAVSSSTQEIDRVQLRKNRKDKNLLLWLEIRKTNESSKHVETSSFLRNLDNEDVETVFDMIREMHDVMADILRLRDDKLAAPICCGNQRVRRQ